MKTIYLLSIVILITTSCKKSSSPSSIYTDVVVEDTLNAWVKVQVDAPEIDDIFFTSPSKGMLVTGINGIFSSSDGGNTWDSIPGTKSIPAYNLQFVDSLNGFAQGFDLWATDDGGKTWTDKLSSNYAKDIQFLSPYTGFYYNSSYGIFSTRNGGASWEKSLAINVFDGNVQGYPFFFLDSLRGFSMMNGSSYKTTDGGLSWTKLGNVTTRDFTGHYKMQFLDTLTGYCGTPEGLLKTTNGGKNWVTCFKMTNPQVIFQLPRFFDIDNGYLMTNDGIYKTTNGGQTWSTSCRIGGGLSFKSIFFLDINTGWATVGISNYFLMLKP